ncbi:MAG: PIN domain-containing protein [Pseudonocardiales bacterium]|nr:PIN domain-containing protein [Pseudonocardiales bacterium]
MRVVADSHVLIFYLFTPDRLSEPALEALGEAEDGLGIVVSAATLGDLWYASHKSGPNSLAPGAFESLRRTVLDPATNFNVVPITVDTMDHFARVPLIDLADPFDRFVLATAAQLRIPLVTADRAMSKAGVVPVIR